MDSSGASFHLRHSSSLRNASSINLFSASSNGSLASDKRTGKAHITPPESKGSQEARGGLRIQRNPSALQDHFQRFTVDERSSASNVGENGRRHYPASQSAFRESTQPVVERRRPPLRAAPWAEMPSSRLRPKVIPESSTVIGFRRKSVAGHQTGKETQTEAPHHAKRRVAYKAPTESRPPAPPPRDTSDPRYRCTPNLLRFSPRVSTMTPRKKVAGQRTGFLSWVDLEPKPRRIVKPTPDPSAPPERACLDQPKHRARKHVSPHHVAGETIFSGSAPTWHPAKKQSSADLNASELRHHASSKRIVPNTQAQSRAVPWATAYERSPFDPGSSRVVKPFAAQPRSRHVDPTTK